MTLCIHGRRLTVCIPCKGKFTCEHGKRKDSCISCKPKSYCVHGRRKYICKDCGGKGICKHGRTRQNCAPCGGASVCVTHKRQGRSCRECFPLAWAKRKLSAIARGCRQGGYLKPQITAKEILKLIEEKPFCCGCGDKLNYDLRGFEAPCLHHNHSTGEVIGFAHRECNSLEGQLSKLGTRLSTFLKNFFPELIL